MLSSSRQGIHIGRSILIFYGSQLKLRYYSSLFQYYPVSHTKLTIHSPINSIYCIYRCPILVRKTFQLYQYHRIIICMDKLSEYPQNQSLIQWFSATGRNRSGYLSYRSEVCQVLPCVLSIWSSPICLIVTCLHLSDKPSGLCTPDDITIH